MIPPSVAEAGLRLVHDGRTIAPARVASTRADRRRGLLGVTDVRGVLVLRARSVHTVGMRVGIDVAQCDRRGIVRRLSTVPPGRVTRPTPLAPVAIEAAAGSFSAWGVHVGDRLELVS